MSSHCRTITCLIGAIWIGGVNGHGVKIANTPSLSIGVAPPAWKDTRVFLAGVLLLTGAGGLLIFVVRKRSQLMRDRRDALMEARRARDELEQRVEERTRDLQAVNARLELEVVQRIKARDELVASERRFRTLAENVPGTIYLCRNDERFTMLYLSENVERLTGYPAEDFLENRTSFVELFHPDDADGVFAGVDAGVRERRRFHLVYRIRRRDGAWCWIEEFGIGVHDVETGELLYLEGFLHDITDRKNADELEAQRQAELAHVSRVVTLGEMAAGFAHELNQPLATILNNTEAMIRRLRSGATEPEYLIEVMEEVADQTSLAGEIVRRIRKFVQKEPPQRKPVLVASLIQDASRLVDFELRKADVDLSIHVDENLPKALVDPIQVEQVLLNLIRNAVDAMSAAPLTDRRIAINAMPGPSEWIEIAVQDSGPGVPNAALDKIFDPFFSTREKGMGLGLAISRTIIESHGGRLWMEPSTKGAMFRFTLPSSSEDLTYDI